MRKAGGPGAGARLRWAAMVAALLAARLGAAWGGELAVYSDRPYPVTFPDQDARFVRFVVSASNTGNEPCVDELEVYGPDGQRNLALAANGAKASASSCLPGYAAHAIEHLNDGEYGNAQSWIPATAGEEWAQIELPRVMRVCKVVFSRDRLGQFGDRIPTQFEVRLSVDGQDFRTVRKVVTVGISGALGPQGGAAPALPPPPPPPAFGPTGRLLVAREPADLRALRQDALGLPNLALLPGVKAAASSVYGDGSWPVHQIPHLIDGLPGNAHSWISKGDPSWVEVDLGSLFWVHKVAFGSDSSGQYDDRAITDFRVLTATDYSADSTAPQWRPALRYRGAPVHLRQEFSFPPVQARWVRLAIEAAASGEARIDELEVYGQRNPIPPLRLSPMFQQEEQVAGPGEELLKYAFVGEEHAWLKTFGRADLDPNLVPYNGRVREYPRHVGQDRLPLPMLPAAPALDGRLDDPAWRAASRGGGQVADPYDLTRSPLVESAVWAGWRGDNLYLAVQVDHLLSAHVAVLSSADWQGCGVVTLTGDGLSFNTYKPQDGQLKLDHSTRLQGAFSRDLRRFELALPLALLPDCRERGVRVGLGMGGRHTPPEGRPVSFTFAPLAVAEAGPCLGGVFRVRLSVPAGAGDAALSANVPELTEGLTVAAGQSREVLLKATGGSLGPECNLRLSDARGGAYELHLFRPDLLQRPLDLMAELADRLEARGLDVRAERAELARLRVREAELLAQPGRGDDQRQAAYEAHLAKRRLFLRDPDLAALSRLLLVKRNAFWPSHIYTDYTDAPFRPGGGVFTLEIPRREGRLAPEAGKLTRLFDAGGGIARDPAATFDLSHVYFGYRPAADDFYHLMTVNLDGGGLRQLTRGPFHDFYPCPLPDGGLAFISTRCTSRVFCFRGPSSVLFRMNPDGSDLRPLSFSSLSEWAPSVMHDGRIIWTRWEYIDKGADFSQTLWSIRPDGTHPELVFGNDIIQPNGYACGREVPGTGEISCTLVSHFGDINGPLALLEPGKGRSNPRAIHSLTPEVPWPGMWPSTECFRDPVPVTKDLFLCAHAPRDRFGLYLVDRFGNRELLYLDPALDSMGATLLRPQTPPPAVAPSTVAPNAAAPSAAASQAAGPYPAAQLLLSDVYRGLEPAVARGRVQWLRVVEEVRHDVHLEPNLDHADFMKWYASPVDVVSGPYGWPTYVAKAPLGLVRVEADGSARFTAPAGKVLYFQALDGQYNELQRMRSVVQLQPGETRSCIGCHEGREEAAPLRRSLALAHPPQALQPHPWGDAPFSYERVVQPVLDARCVRCHTATHAKHVNLTGALDAEKIPASYRTLISGGWVHFVDCGWNSAGCEKREPLTFGTVKSKLWPLLAAGHHGVALSDQDALRLKTWTDLNCPLWPDYIERSHRPG